MFTKHSCETCEFLKLELYKAQDLNNRLLEKLLAKPEVPIEVEHELPQPIGTQYVPWHIKRAQLEKEDREKFKAIQDAKVEYTEEVKTTEQLEREVL
jgi:hypothetical protein